MTASKNLTIKIGGFIVEVNVEPCDALLKVWHYGNISSHGTPCFVIRFCANGHWEFFRWLPGTSEGNGWLGFTRRIDASRTVRPSRSRHGNQSTASPAWCRCAPA